MQSRGLEEEGEKRMIQLRSLQSSVRQLWQALHYFNRRVLTIKRYSIVTSFTCLMGMMDGEAFVDFWTPLN
jgi:hypothetical protein